MSYDVSHLNIIFSHVVKEYLTRDECRKILSVSAEENF